MEIVLWSCVKDVEEPLTGVTHFEDAGEVSTSIAVVWSTPHRAQPVIVEDLVSFLAQLMGS